MLINYIVCMQPQINNASKNNWSSTLGMLGQLFFLVIIFIIILFMAYYCTRWIAGSKLRFRKNSNFEIVESISVGYQSTIQIIKVGEKFLLIGVTKDNISFLSEIEKDSIKINSDKTVEKGYFDKYLEQYLNKRKKQD